MYMRRRLYGGPAGPVRPSAKRGGSAPRHRMLPCVRVRTSLIEIGRPDRGGAVAVRSADTLLISSSHPLHTVSIACPSFRSCRLGSAVTQLAKLHLLQQLRQCEGLQRDPVAALLPHKTLRVRAFHPRRHRGGFPVRGKGLGSWAGTVRGRVEEASVSDIEWRYHHRARLRTEHEALPASRRRWQVGGRRRGALPVAPARNTDARGRSVTR